MTQSAGETFSSSRLRQLNLSDKGKNRHFNQTQIFQIPYDENKHREQENWEKNKFKTKKAMKMRAMYCTYGFIWLVTETGASSSRGIFIYFFSLLVFRFLFRFFFLVSSFCFFHYCFCSFVQKGRIELGRIKQTKKKSTKYKQNPAMGSRKWTIHLYNLVFHGLIYISSKRQKGTSFSLSLSRFHL